MTSDDALTDESFEKLRAAVREKYRTVAHSELFRVLRNGGTLAVADLIVVDTIPAHVLADMDAWSTCIAGALRGKDCLEKLQASGFTQARILGPTGCSTSRFTAADHVIATKRGEPANKGHRGLRFHDPWVLPDHGPACCDGAILGTTTGKVPGNVVRELDRDARCRCQRSTLHSWAFLGQSADSLS